MPGITERRIFGLDLMRAIAISLVLFSHAVLFLPRGNRFAGLGLLAGYFGVELFFVLSGFLIGGILLRGFENDSSTAGLGQFWIRRWFRTLPNYLLFLGVNIAIAMWLGRNPSRLWPYFAFLQNLVAAPRSFFVESWSLAVEEWFYLLVPIAFFVGLRSARRPLQRLSLSVIVTSILTVTIARTMYVFVKDPIWLTDVRMIVPFRLDACMFGVLGAWLKRYLPQLWNRIPRSALAAGLLLLVFMTVVPFVSNPDSIFVRTIGFSVTSFGALLLLPYLAGWQSSMAPASTLITKISLWSYSLYLVNLPLGTMLRRFTGGAQPWLVASVFAVLSIAMAALIFEIYERPMTNLRDRRPFEASRRVGRKATCAEPAVRTAAG